MRRRDFIKGVVGSTAWSFAALAQQSKPVRLGYLVGEAREDPALQNLRRQFVLGMGDLGYIEGRNSRWRSVMPPVRWTGSRVTRKDWLTCRST
jgi:hypothetical protein